MSRFLLLLHNEETIFPSGYQRKNPQTLVSILTSVDIVYIIYIQYLWFVRRSTLNIIISNSSRKPIYEQISSQIKSMIISGALNEGDPLPSMRLLAKELRISVITTKKAYEELERDGFITSLPGRGSYVAGKNMDFIREEHLRRIEELMQEIVTLSAGCNLSLDELLQMFALIYKGE